MPTWNEAGPALRGAACEELLARALTFLSQDHIRYLEKAEKGASTGRAGHDDLATTPMLKAHLATILRAEDQILQGKLFDVVDRLIGEHKAVPVRLRIARSGAVDWTARSTKRP